MLHSLTDLVPCVMVSGSEALNYPELMFIHLIVHVRSVVQWIEEVQYG